MRESQRKQAEDILVIDLILIQRQFGSKKGFPEVRWLTDPAISPAGRGTQYRDNCVYSKQPSGTAAHVYYLVSPLNYSFFFATWRNLLIGIPFPISISSPNLWGHSAIASLNCLSTPLWAQNVLERNYKQADVAFIGKGWLGEFFCVLYKNTLQSNALYTSMISDFCNKANRHSSTQLKYFFRCNWFSKL